MSDNQNKQPNECKCEGGKEIKALKKQVDELVKKVDSLETKIITFRKVLTR